MRTFTPKPRAGLWIAPLVSHKKYSRLRGDFEFCENPLILPLLVIFASLFLLPATSALTLIDNGLTVVCLSWLVTYTSLPTSYLFVLFHLILPVLAAGSGTRKSSGVSLLAAVGVVTAVAVVNGAQSASLAKRKTDQHGKIEEAASGRPAEKSPPKKRKIADLPKDADSSSPPKEVGQTVGKAHLKRRKEKYLVIDPEATAVWSNPALSLDDQISATERHLRDLKERKIRQERLRQEELLQERLLEHRLLEQKLASTTPTYEPVHSYDAAGFGYDKSANIIEIPESPQAASSPEPVVPPLPPVPQPTQSVSGMPTSHLNATTEALPSQSAFEFDIQDLQETDPFTLLFHLNVDTESFIFPPFLGENTQIEASLGTSLPTEGLNLQTVPSNAQNNGLPSPSAAAAAAAPTILAADSQQYGLSDVNTGGDDWVLPTQADLAMQGIEESANIWFPETEMERASGAPHVVRGLPNLGSTCWLNAGLQILLADDEIRAALKVPTPREDLNISAAYTNNPDIDGLAQQITITDAWCRISKNLSLLVILYEANAPCVKMLPIMKEISSDFADVDPTLKFGQQSDSNTLAAFILDVLLAGRLDVVVEQVTLITCPSRRCKRVPVPSINQGSALTLTLHPDYTDASLASLLTESISQTVPIIDFKCEVADECNRRKGTNASQTMSYPRLPAICLVVLARSNVRRCAITTPDAFEVVVDGQVIKAEVISSTHYSLTETKTGPSGHYWAKVKTPTGWVVVNDSETWLAGENEAGETTVQAYLLRISPTSTNPDLVEHPCPSTIHDEYDLTKDELKALLDVQDELMGTSFQPDTQDALPSEDDEESLYSVEEKEREVEGERQQQSQHKGECDELGDLAEIGSQSHSLQDPLEGSTHVDLPSQNLQKPVKPRKIRSKANASNPLASLDENAEVDAKDTLGDKKRWADVRERIAQASGDCMIRRQALLHCEELSKLKTAFQKVSGQEITDLGQAILDMDAYLPQLVHKISLSSSDKAFLLKQIQIAAEITKSGKFGTTCSLDLIYALHVYSDEQFLTLLLAGVVDTASISLMRTSHSAGSFAPTVLDSLTTVEREHRVKGIYMHTGFPASLDGPNKLKISKRLLYIGSGQAAPRAEGAALGTARAGVSRRVFEQHLNQSYRMRTTSHHYRCFYGEPKADKKPLVAQLPTVNKAFIPDSSSSYYLLFRYDWSLPSSLLNFVEAVCALSMHAFEPGFESTGNHPWSRAGYVRPKNVDWTGTNRQWPTQDNSKRDSSEIQSQRGKIGGPASNKVRNLKATKALLAGTYKSICKVEKDRGFAIPKMQGTTAPNIALGKAVAETVFENYQARFDGFLRFYPVYKTTKSWRFVLYGENKEELSYFVADDPDLNASGKKNLAALATIMISIIDENNLQVDE